MFRTAYNLFSAAGYMTPTGGEMTPTGWEGSIQGMPQLGGSWGRG